MSSPCSHLGFGNYVEVQLLVHQTGPGLGEVALVEDQTVPAKTARTAELLEPLGPLGVELPVGLLVLRLEDADDLLQASTEQH